MKVFILFIFILLSGIIYSQEIYYNRDGKKVNNSNEAYIYCKKTENNACQCFYKNSDKLYFEGNVVQFAEIEDSSKFIGNCIWYFNNGKIQKKLNYDENSRLDGYQQYLYENGNLWKEYQLSHGKMLENFYYEYDENQNKYIIYEDNFDNNKYNWDLYESTKGKSSILNKKFYLNSYTKEGTSRFVYFDYNLNNDLIVETKIKITSRNSSAGLIIGLKDMDNFIYFLYDNLGNISLGYFYEGARIDKLSNLKSFDIKPNEENVLKFIYKDKKFTFIVNGQVQYSSEYFKLFGNKIGFLSLGNAQLTADYLKIKTLTSVNEKTAKNEDEKLKGTGTGFLIKDNYIITCYHVIEKANDIYVQIKENGDNSVFKAIVAQKDKTNDLALLKVTDEKWINKPQWTNIALGISVGETVFTLGYPLAYNGMGKEIKYSDGKISSKTGYNDNPNSFQTSIPAQPGNSGSPIFNEKGELIGIINSKIENADNVTYGIKVNNILNLLDIENIQLNKDITSPKKIDEMIPLYSPNIEIIKIY